ncbi:MAG TPA: hypothetical protein VNT23_08975 [Gaiellaceae bacterium]|nr:hypothetical protein [Gaiellaceae bacterium]
MDAAHTTRRRTLGQIMLDEGMLRQDQLDVALAQQRESDRPLGEVLVGLGFVSPGAVANVLAEQHGGLLKTEYGLSTGLHGSASPAPAAAKREPTPQPAPAPTPDPAPPEPAVADDLLERWRDAVPCSPVLSPYSVLRRPPCCSASTFATAPGETKPSPTSTSPSGRSDSRC